MVLVKSAVKHLLPITILEAGRELKDHELQSILAKLCEYTTSEANRIWQLNQSLLELAIASTGKKSIPYKQRFLRDSGADSTMTPVACSLVGNLRELVEYKIVSEASSWIKNSSPHKQPFVFNGNLDLSATGNRFSSLSYSQEEGKLLVHLRALERTIDLVFQLPKYVLPRKITKISKPRIRWTGSEYVFDFTLFEEVSPAKGRLVAGVDLGKHKPYVSVVANQRGKRVASFEASLGLKRGWNKYHQLTLLASQLKAKLERKTNLGLTAPILERELGRVHTKKNRLHAELSKQQATELARKLSALPVSLVRVEDLSWLAGSKGKTGRGGRWSYARQQADLEHALARRGVKQEKKSPRNSSQVCCRCGANLAHRGRSVCCAECKSTMDRDFNAAMNMATLNHLKSKEWLAKFYGLGEVSCSKEQVSAILNSPEVVIESDFVALAAESLT